MSRGIRNMLFRGHSLDGPRRRRFRGHQGLSEPALPTFRRADRAYDLPAYSFPQNGTEPGQARPPQRYKGTAAIAYVVVYTMKPEAIEILHIYHGSQDWR